MSKHEVLFCGKRVDNGEWIEGSLVSGSENLNTSRTYICPKIQAAVFHECYAMFSGFIEVDPKTISQYTGLVDKNGVKIFEGDIIRTKYGRICSVVWFQLNACFDMEPILDDNTFKTKAPDKYDLWYSGNLEVVGNKYDKDQRVRER